MKTGEEELQCHWNGKGDKTQTRSTILNAAESQLKSNCEWMVHLHLQLRGFNKMTLE